MPSLDITAARLATNVRKSVDGSEVIFYVIDVTGVDGEQWKVERRYTEFSGLRMGLLARHASVSRLSFPGKGPFASTADREKELRIWIDSLFRSGAGVSNDPQLRAFLVPTEMEAGDRESLYGSFMIPPSEVPSIPNGSPGRESTAPTYARANSGIRAPSTGRLGTLQEREMAARQRAEEAEQELVNLRTTVSTLRTAVARCRESVQSITDKQKGELEKMHRAAVSVTQRTSTQVSVASRKWSLAFRVQAVVAVFVAVLLRVRGVVSGALGNVLLCVVPALAGVATTFFGGDAGVAVMPPKPVVVDASDALKRLGAIDYELSCATGAVVSDHAVGEKVQVWHEIEKPDGSWDLISAPAVIQSRLPDGRVEVAWEDGGDPYLISTVFLGPGGEKAARDAVSAVQAGPGDKVQVWYEEEDEHGACHVTSSEATVVSEIGDGSSVEVDGVKGGTDRFVIERKYLGPGGEVEVRLAMDRQECSSPRRKVARPRLMPAGKQAIVPLNESGRVALELFSSGGWKLEKTDKRGGVVVCRFDSKMVDWSPTKACKFSCEVNCSMQAFYELIVMNSPKGAKEFDALLDHYEVLNEGDRYEGHTLYTNFFSPVPRVIGRRDFVTIAQDALLTKEEVEKYGIQIQGEYPATIDTRALEQSNMNFDNMVYCVSNMSVTHPSRPANTTFVRGHAHAHCYLIVGRGPDKIWLCEVQSLNPNGSIPAWAVDLGAVKVIERFVNLRNYLEREYKAQYLNRKRH
eukprot:Hpha_TRINITY_DN15839_c2_g5::TRINITY_DN15839_c2_g5_i2::g.186868::m.186868